MQVLDLNFFETEMKTERKRTVIHTVHYIFELMWAYPDNIKQDQVSILKYYDYTLNWDMGHKFLKT